MAELRCKECHEDLGGCRCSQPKFRVAIDVMDIFSHTEDWAPDDIPAKETSSEVAEVNLSDLFPSQSWLDSDKLQHWVDMILEKGYRCVYPRDHTEGKPARIWTNPEGQQFIADGHHRLGAAILCGAASVKVKKYR